LQSPDRFPVHFPFPFFHMNLVSYAALVRRIDRIHSKSIASYSVMFLEIPTYLPRPVSSLIRDVGSHASVCYYPGLAPAGEEIGSNGGGKRSRTARITGANKLNSAMPG